MTNFGWSYPPGTENDPNAPWNQPDPVECEGCKGTGLRKNEDGEEEACLDCEATGWVDPRSLIDPRWEVPVDWKDNQDE